MGRVWFVPLVKYRSDFIEHIFHIIVQHFYWLFVGFLVVLRFGNLFYVVHQLY